nr:MAG TPA: hypothetical protein [Inoviridae sp.]
MQNTFGSFSAFLFLNTSHITTSTIIIIANNIFTS